MGLLLLIVGVLLGGCSAIPAETRRPELTPTNQQGGSDTSPAGSAVEKEAPSPEEMAKGHTFRDIYKPIALSCGAWNGLVKQAEGFCAKSLFVDGCGEKDEAGKPTGLYRNNDCPDCESLARLRARANSAGCGP